jgi:hypothetical protein
LAGITLIRRTNIVCFLAKGRFGWHDVDETGQTVYPYKEAPAAPAEDCDMSIACILSPLFSRPPYLCENFDCGWIYMPSYEQLPTS